MTVDASVEVLVIGAQRFTPLLTEVPQLARLVMVGLARHPREAGRRSSGCRDRVQDVRDGARG